LITKTKRDLASLSDSKGLTPRGEAALLTDDDRRIADQKRDLLQTQLAELNLEEDELMLKIRDHAFAFSSDLTIVYP